MSCIFNQCESIRQLLHESDDLDKAPAFIANDFVNCWEILLNNPGKCKMAILFEEEKARVNFPGGDITGRVNRYIDIIISRGRGLQNVRSDNLTKGSGGGLPLYQLAEKMRDKLRAVSFDPQTDEHPNYVGLSRWGKDEGFNIDAFKVSIWIGSQLDMISNVSDTNPNTLPL